MERPGAVIAERFELESEIASGGMGTVFRARDRATGGWAAVKVLRGDDLVDTDRFARECAALSRLAHPGIVRYIAHGQAPLRFLAMDWISGVTLAQRLDETGLSVAETVHVGAQLAAALAAVHAAGVIHRDLKPSNVMFRDGDLDAAMLIDFGISRVPGTPAVTRTGMTVGTPGYMAPEQAVAKGVLESRSDVFALGCVLYECLTGRPAFSGANALAIQTKICLGQPEPATRLCPEVPAALVALLDAMLAKAADRRPAASEVAARLAALAPGVTAGGPARSRRELLDTPTSQVAAPAEARTALRCTVLCSAANDPTPREVASAIAERFSGGAESMLVFDDWTLAAEVVGDDPGAVVRAAEFALRLREALPDHIVVITCDAAGGPAVAIDRGSQVLVTAVLEAIFDTSGKPERIVYVDREVQKRLTDDALRMHFRCIS
jgi:eukaryotic-like serine/threonine-protein kinase